MRPVNFAKKQVREALEARDFRKTESIKAKTDQLAILSEAELKDDILGSRALDLEWPAIEAKLGGGFLSSIQQAESTLATEEQYTT